MPIFTVEEARGFAYQGEYQLADADAYPNELIEATAARIAEDFAAICGVAFVPTTTTRVLDGVGSADLLLPDARVSAVDSVEGWDGTTWAATAVAYRLLDGDVLLYDGGRWGRGRANLRVSYTHGYAEPPAPIKRAALILAVNDLVSSNVSDRATQQTNEFGSYNLAVPGWKDGQWYGLPIVDSVLQRYSERLPRVG